MLLQVNSKGQKKVLLDLQNATFSQPSEAGLLGFDTYPHFNLQPWVFLSYNHRPEGQGRFVSRLSRFSYDKKNQRIFPKSEFVLLEIPQPYSNHNGGHIQFGPDHHLY